MDKKRGEFRFLYFKFDKIYGDYICTQCGEAISVKTGYQFLLMILHILNPVLGVLIGTFFPAGKRFLGICVASVWTLSIGLGIQYGGYHLYMSAIQEHERTKHGEI